MLNQFLITIRVLKELLPEIYDLRIAVVCGVDAHQAEKKICIMNAENLDEDKIRKLKLIK